jgi:hypothetical protein
MTCPANIRKVGQRLDMSNPSPKNSDKGYLTKKTLNSTLLANIDNLYKSYFMTRHQTRGGASNMSNLSNLSASYG